MENYFENDAKKFSAYLNKKIEAGITELECYFTGDIEDFDVFMNKAELKEGWHYSSYSYSKMSDYYKANITLTYNSKEIEQKKLAEENLRKFQSQENYFYNVEDYFAYVTKMVENGEHYITCYVDTEVKNPSRCLDFSKVPDCKMDDYQFDEVLGGGYYLVYLYNDTLYHTFQVLKRQDNYFYNTEDFYAYVNQQVVKGEKQIVCYIDLSIDDLWEFTRTSQVNGSVTGISYGTNKYYHTVEFRVE